MKPFIGLAGILLAAMVSQFNDQVTSLALVDIRGALGISYDPNVDPKPVRFGADRRHGVFAPGC